MAQRQRSARNEVKHTTGRELERFSPSMSASSMHDLTQELVRFPTIHELLSKDGPLAHLLAETLEQLLTTQTAYTIQTTTSEPQATISSAAQPSTQGEPTKLLEGPTNTLSALIPPEQNRPSDNQLDEKIIALYAKGLSIRDIQETLRDVYDIDLSTNIISATTDKVWAQVEAWQSRPLAAIYPIVYLDAIHLKVRRDGKVANTAAYIALGIDLSGHRDVLGHWIGDGAEGANFWLSVVTDLQARGVQDIFIACVDGLPGFKAAIQSVFPHTYIQRCIIHQVRHSLSYVSWKDRKAFAGDLQAIYGAPTREAAETRLWRLIEKWGKTYAIAVRSWENNWEDLATMFEFATDIRRLIYTTNLVESYNGQIRRVTNTKGSFPSAEALRKLMFLANRTITRRWSKTTLNWAGMLNQLAIRFEERFPAT